MERMKISIRILGGYLFVHEEEYTLLGVVGSLKIVRRQFVYATENYAEPIPQEHIIEKGILSLYAENWADADPVQYDETVSKLRNLRGELESYYTELGKPYSYPPIQFEKFDVLLFFNHGRFGADLESLPQAGSNLTTRQPIVKPAPLCRFEIAGDNQICLWHGMEQLLALRGMGVIRELQLDLVPLRIYDSLPVLGYEGSQGPGNDKDSPRLRRARPSY